MSDDLAIRDLGQLTQDVLDTGRLSISKGKLENSVRPAGGFPR